MVYKRFRLVLIVRILLLGSFMFLFFYLILNTSYYAATLIVGVMIVYQFAILIHYVEKTNRDLTRFLDAIKYSDFSQTFMITGMGSSFNDLKTAFNEVIMKFQQARAEKEEHYRYLQTVVQHIGIGLISYNANGEVSLINQSAKRLLNISYLKNIKSLESFNLELVQELFNLKSGQKRLINVNREGETLQLMIYATEFKMQQRNYTLVSIQNIGSELEEKEMEAWQKLIRVLTHEIMNSITPISSLASTANELIDETVNNANILDESVNDISNALKTIHNRSQGLLSFVDAYRTLTRIPRPNFTIFPVNNLFHSVHVLLKDQLRDKGISCRQNIYPESLEVTADQELIEQILINLMLNAIQALDNQPEACIEMAARLDDRGRVLIQVADNGPGIDKEVQEKIFIPFFTTKKGGSGIGLSLSRQIMRLHRGSISVRSEPRVKTTFTLRF